MGLKVLIVDDDEIAGGLSRDLLNESGAFDADVLTDSVAALDVIRRNRYPMVLLDILMPGVDGLTLLHRIKNDPQTKDTKVVIVSAKAFEAEKQRAREYGADLFIEKPYNVETFVQQISEVAGRTKETPAPGSVPSAELLSASRPVLQLAVWGCRSLPGLKSPASARYGRKTSCLSVDAGDRLLVFDAGSGLEALGERIVAQGKHKEIWIFLTHFHKDHTQGLGSFACARTPGCTLHISGVNEPDKTLQDLVQEAFESSMTDEGAVEADIDLYEVLEESYEVCPGLMLSTFYANHPGTTLGYILETKGRKLIYCPDSEVYGEGATALQDYDEKLARACAGADLLIHDGRYTAEDYQTLRNNGHSSFVNAVDLAGRSGVKRLLLWHHDSQYDDATLDRMGAEAARIIAQKNYTLQCALAREGLKIGI